MAAPAQADTVEHVRLDDIDVNLTPDLRFLMSGRLGVDTTHDALLDFEMFRRLHGRMTKALIAYSVATGRRDI
jgi:hypothetical protein